MKNQQKVYICQSCSAEHLKWMGQCPSCKQWGTLVETSASARVTSASVVRNTERTSRKNSDNSKSTPLAHHISQIPEEQNNRFFSGDPELDRVLGGGIVPGSITLFGGSPGIGKSTLLLQTSLSINTRVLYISGEESEQQVKMHVQRIQGGKPREKGECFVLNETNLEEILHQIKKIAPGLVVVDSIQTVYSSLLEGTAGSISQVRQCTQDILLVAKSLGIAVFLVGHITKEGSIAGPKVLEHIVDTVLYFEGDKSHLFRLLRVSKNRFGSTSELGIYEMKSTGLVAVNNPSQVFVSRNSRLLSGVSTAVVMEGARPFMVEVQALVSPAVYGVPQRTSTGFNAKRLNMLLAVLEKRAGFKLSQKDVFINIAGGLSVDDPAIDLPIISAILSSNVDMPTEPTDAFVGEVGLTGEVRPVSRIEQRIQEAEKMGYKRIFISRFCKVEATSSVIEVKRISNVKEFFDMLFKVA